MFQNKMAAVVLVAMLAVTALATGQDMNSFFNSLHSGNDYCKICTSHTACIYKGDGKSCEKIRSGVSSVDQADVLRAHNEKRRGIALGKQKGQPPAANMREMVWDPELAMVAQRWADQCTFHHDKCRDVSRFKVGQNVAYTASTKPSTDPEWSRAVDSWYSEVKLWRGDNVKSYVALKGTGHYTQMVWADTYLLGCGYSVYPHETKKRMSKKLYVCNYGPMGNEKRVPIYQIGNACSACPPDTTCKNGLCALNNNNNNNASEEISCVTKPCPKNLICTKGVCLTLKSIL